MVAKMSHTFFLLYQHFSDKLAANSKNKDLKKFGHPNKLWDRTRIEIYIIMRNKFLFAIYLSQFAGL